MAIFFSPWFWTALAGAFGFGWLKGGNDQPETPTERTGGRMIWVIGGVVAVGVYGYFKWGRKRAHS